MKKKVMDNRSGRIAVQGAVENSVKLGQVLVRAGRIKTDDLELALKEQGASQRRIGEILIEKGFIRPEELNHGLNVQSILTSCGISTDLSFESVLEGRSTMTPHDETKDT